MKKYNQQWVDDEIPKKEVFDEMFRVSKDVIIWGGNYFLDYLGSTKCFLIYDKKQPQGISFASCEFAWTSFDKNAKIFTHVRNTGEKRVHICQKPIALYEWILDNYANAGDKIFDPCLGSGSSRIAAYRKGFDFYGCELNKTYFEDAEKRFKRAICEQELF